MDGTNVLCSHCAGSGVLSHGASPPSSSLESQGSGVGCTLCFSISCCCSKALEVIALKEKRLILAHSFGGLCSGSDGSLLWGLWVVAGAARRGGWEAKRWTVAGFPTFLSTFPPISSLPLTRPHLPRSPHTNSVTSWAFSKHLRCQL